MTLHSLFDLSTMEHRHLLLAYVAVALIQATYAARLIRSWLQSKP